MTVKRFGVAIFATLYVATLMSLPLGSRAVAASATTFSGQATVVNGTIVGIPITLVDTGPVDAGGGSLHAHLLKYPDGLPDLTDGALTAEVLHASVIAQGDRSRAEARVADVQVKVGSLTIGASLLAAEAMAVCKGGTATITASSEIADLTINGQPVTVAGGMGETILLPGGQIVINEQVGSASAGNGDVTVNALHVTLTDPLTGKPTDIIIASAHADIHCAQQPAGCGPKDFVTGGGWVTAPSGGRANFAVAGADGGWGHLLYIDHGAGGPRVKGTGVLTYTTTGLTSRHIRGSADIDGKPGSYDVDVADNGEPGHDVDTFMLVLSTGYSSGGTLKGGNIQLHCK